MPKNPNWQKVPLREILTHVEDLVPRQDFREYITITVKRRHGGLEPRGRSLGHEIKTKKQYRLIPGAFLISRIQCWHQAYAMVPEDVPDNMIASQNYDQFIISSKVDSRFFWWFSHSPLFTETVRSSAFGVVIEKMVFNREAWLDKLIPLPPLDEQRRIVSRIEELAVKVQEVKRLKEKASEESEALMKSALRQLFISGDGLAQVKLEDVCETIIDNLHRNPVYADTGVACVRSPDVGWGELFLDRALSTDEDEYQRRTVRGEPRPDDIVFVREGGGTGKAAMVKQGQRFSLGQRVMMIRPNKALVSPKFFLYQMLSPHIYEDQILELTKGSASPHLNIGAFRKFTFFLPPMETQTEIVTYLDHLKIRMHYLQTLQSETAAELDALMPSILNKAFRGEL